MEAAIKTMPPIPTSSTLVTEDCVNSSEPEFHSSINSEEETHEEMRLIAEHEAFCLQSSDWLWSGDTCRANAIELEAIAQIIGAECGKPGQVKVAPRPTMGTKVIVQFNRWELTEILPEEERNAMAQYVMCRDGSVPIPCRAVRTECVTFDIPHGRKMVNSLAHIVTNTEKMVMAFFNFGKTMKNDGAVLIDVYVLQDRPKLANMPTAMIRAPPMRTPSQCELTQRPTYNYDPPPPGDHLTHTLGAPAWLKIGTGVNVVADGLLPGQRYCPHTYPSHGITSAEDFVSYVGYGNARQLLLDSKHDAVVLANEPWVAGGKAKYTVQLKGIPAVMTELDVVDWVRQFGYR